MLEDLPVVSPQPTGSRRVQASKKRRRPDGDLGLASKLLKRQLGGNQNGAASGGRLSCNATDAYRDLTLQGQFDTFDGQQQQQQQQQQQVQQPLLARQQRRSKVLEIISAHDIVFTLVNSGICTAFDRVSGKRLCTLNVRPDEVVRSLFWNKLSQSLITVSVYSADNYASLHCRSVSAACVRAGQPHEGRILFEDASLKWPGFVEFDDVNSKVLTYSASARMYKVYHLDDYRLLYTLSNSAVQDLKVSPGIMLMIMQQEVAPDGSTYVPLRVHNIEDGSIVKEFRHRLESNDRIDFAEQFNEMLLIKQEGKDLVIVDIMPAIPQRVATTDFTTPTAFIFLYDRDLFLTFRKHHVAVWNFDGEMVTEFGDHELFYSDSHTSSIYITTAQDLIVSYCKISRSSLNVVVQNGQDTCRGSINVSNVLTGRCISKIQAPQNANSDAGRAAQAALTDVTALFVCEDNHEIFTGTANGLIHKWAA